MMKATEASPILSPSHPNPKKAAIKDRHSYMFLLRHMMNKLANSIYYQLKCWMDDYYKVTTRGAKERAA